MHLLLMESFRFYPIQEHRHDFHTRERSRLIVGPLKNYWRAEYDNF